jgi:hypothetical protein
MLSLPYVRLVNMSRIRPKSFTRVAVCGMNGEVSGARILLSPFPSFPDTGTGPQSLDRTSV